MIHRSASTSERARPLVRAWDSAGDSPRGAGRTIALLVPSVDGRTPHPGIHAALLGLALLLERAGHRVSLLYPLHAEAAEASPSLPFALPADSAVRLVSIPVAPSQALIHYRWTTQQAYYVYEWLKRHPFEVVHLAERTGAGYFALLARRQGVAFEATLFVVGCHGATRWQVEENRELHAKVEWLEAGYMEQRSVELADHVWSPGASPLTWMQTQGWSCSAVEPLHPLPPAVLPPLSQAPGTRPVSALVFFGRLNYRKGTWLFCQALDRLVAAGGPLPAEVIFLGPDGQIGSDSGVAFVAERAQAWPFPVRVLPDLGRDAALEVLAAPGRLAVMPSLADHAPATVLECLALGLPFITTDQGGIPALIDSADQSAVCSPPLAAALAKRLGEALVGGHRAACPAFDFAESERHWLDWHARVMDASGAQAPLPAGEAPLVSVCLTHHNRAHFLAQAVASLRRQDYSPFEVILVDDGSTQSEALAYLDSLEAEFAERGWRILRQENRYNGAARNHAARHARGQYLLFMDDDNLAEPHELSVFVRAAERTGADVLGCFYAGFSGLDGPEGQEITWQALPLGGALALSLFECRFGDTNSLFRREVFERLGGFGEVIGVGMEDWELLARAALSGARMDVVPEALFRYRLEPGSVSRGGTLPTANFHRFLQPFLRSVPRPFGDMLMMAQGLALDEQLARPRQDTTSPGVISFEAVWHSTSWRVTRPVRNFVRRLQGQEQESLPAFRNELEAARALADLYRSNSWALTAPLRVGKTIASGVSRRLGRVTPAD